MTRIEIELFELLQDIKEAAMRESVSQYLMSQIDRACGLAEVLKERQDDISESLAVFPW